MVQLWEWLFYSYNDGVPRPQCTRHIKRSRHTQFFAPTEATIKESWLYPVSILRMFVLVWTCGALLVWILEMF